MILKKTLGVKIFLPFKKEINPYLDEIINHSLHTYVYDSYKNYNTSYAIVNIHWPEAIFEWKEPTQRELKQLKQNILEWKRNSVLIYTKHDFQRNKGTTKNFTQLFELIEDQADVFIHLGSYSRKLYQKRHPNCQHEIIYHPIFKNSYELYSMIKARKLLGIDQQATVIIAPGNIRSLKERSMVLKSFNALNIKNKVLISTNMRTELQFDFPGRVWMKKYFDVRNFFISKFKKKHQPPQYIFNYNLMSAEDLCLMLSAADIVLVPRVNLLNSGIVFLGITLQKVVVGPAIGNIEEQLKELNFPVFDPKSISSVVNALYKGIKLNLTNDYMKKPLSKYSPINATKEYDRVFSKYEK